jgi:hypothetical protein
MVTAEIKSVVIHPILPTHRHIKIIQKRVMKWNPKKSINKA